MSLEFVCFCVSLSSLIGFLNRNGRQCRIYEISFNSIKDSWFNLRRVFSSLFLSFAWIILWAKWKTSIGYDEHDSPEPVLIFSIGRISWITSDIWWKPELTLIDVWIKIAWLGPLHVWYVTHERFPLKQSACYPLCFVTNVSFLFRFSLTFFRQLFPHFLISFSSISFRFLN